MAAGMCRLCASEKETLISMKYQWETICQKLSTCCHLYIQMDDTLMPKSICQECMGCLNASYNFYIQVQDAQKTLQSYFCRSLSQNKGDIADKNIKLDGSEEYSYIKEIEPKTVLTKELDPRIRNEAWTRNTCEMELEGTANSKPLFTITNVTSLVENNDSPEEYILPEETEEIKTELENCPSHSMPEDDFEQYAMNSAMMLYKVKKEPREAGIEDYYEENKEFEMDKAITVSQTKKDFSTLTPEQQINNWNSYTHICYACDYRASDFQNLISHVDRIHSVTDFDEMQYKCYDCKQIFSVYNAFLTHVRLKHHPCLKLRCDACDLLCPDSNSYAVHRNIICCEAKKYPGDLISKKRKVHLPKQTYKCTICNMEFAQKQSLKNHKHMKERMKYKTAVKKYHCTLCNKEFSQLRGLKRHERNHKKQLEVICDYCGKVFSSIPSLELHMPLHALDTEFKCHICQKSFTKLSLLEKHKGDVHNETKKFKCCICSSRFRTKIEKITHEGDQHASEMPFSCRLCNRRFRWSCQLDVHVAVHSNERKYTCKYCNKSVKDMYYLKRHEQCCRSGQYRKAVQRENKAH